MNSYIALTIVFLCCILYTQMLRLVVPTGANCLHLVVVSEYTENIEQLLRWNLFCVKYNIFLGSGKLVVVDCSMTEPQRYLVSLFKSGHSEITVVPLEEFSLEELARQYNQIRIVV